MEGKKMTNSGIGMVPTDACLIYLIISYHGFTTHIYQYEAYETLDSADDFPYSL